MEITVVIYIYPGVEKYLGDLIKSFNRQTIKTFKVIIFNDNLVNAKHLFKNLNIDFQIIEVEGSVNQIRFNSLGDINEKGSDYIIFQDADDFMAENRIEECSKALDKYDIVVNDLNIIDANSKVLEISYWEKRLQEGFTFDSCYLRNKNIVGLGNTAIKKYLLADARLCFSLMPLAFDWFLFYQIFKLNNLKAVFIKNTATFYRQHQENIAGVKELGHYQIKAYFKC
jgi:glycosyltransferase involved in cell wall biosynthesis